MAIKKSAISLISYDCEYLVDSISKYYNYVDEIVLGLDKDRLSWNNNSFSFDESKLWNDLQVLDGDNKISVIEENFHQSSVAIENDNYERNYLKNNCSNEWLISIDADEMLINAKEFFYDYCPLVEKYNKKVDLCMTWGTPYKIIEDTILVIVNEDDSPFFGENQAVMTHKNNTFVYARWTNLSAAGENRLISPLVSIHWSLCRSEEALKQKINNIGHADLVDKDPFFANWKKVDLNNYSTLRNFKTSGLGSAQWPKLRAIPLNEVENFYKQYAKGIKI